MKQNNLLRIVKSISYTAIPFISAVYKSRFKPIFKMSKEQKKVILFGGLGKILQQLRIV